MEKRLGSAGKGLCAPHLCAAMDEESGGSVRRERVCLLEIDSKAVQMAQTLFDFNCHVLAGDILLLRSGGVLAFGNRFFSRLLRPFRRARYTHVALVLNETHIVDASPRLGVQIRRWDEVASAYDLHRCTVARHLRLATSDGGVIELLKRVQYYYAQRYGIEALARRSVKDEAGIVCSQFVAMVLKDLKVPLSVRKVMQAPPSDIDKGTENVDGWRQFPFITYGLYSNVSMPHPDDPYWLVVSAEAMRVDRTNYIDSTSVLSTVSAKHETDAAIQVQAEAQIEGEDLVDTSMPWADISFGRQISFLTGELMARSMKETTTVLRAIAEIERQMLNVTIGLRRVGSKASIDQLQTMIDVVEGTVDLGPLHGVSSGEAMLKQWRHLFVEHTDASPRILADADAPQRLEKLRVLQSEYIADWLQHAVQQNEMVDTLKQRVLGLRDLAAQGVDISELIVNLHQLALELQKRPRDWLGYESAEVILSRANIYASLVESELLPWASRADSPVVGLQALDQVKGLMNLDEQRLLWVGLYKPALQILTSNLESLRESSLPLSSGNPPV
jgi:hypothetical protein